ncbi:MAG: hypothetical protein GDA67_15820 [Nitrospira sp. CR1.3]|nr:hypothetical protein [Nitrospira sp. CR1.3]
MQIMTVFSVPDFSRVGLRGLTACCTVHVTMFHHPAAHAPSHLVLVLVRAGLRETLDKIAAAHTCTACNKYDCDED